MQTIRVHIVGISQRAPYLEYLRKHLPGAYFYIDMGNAMEAFLASLRAAGDDPIIGMEDDAILCKDFLTKATACIEQHPNDVINFFSRRQDDLTIGSRYVPGSNFIAAICAYYPPGIAREIVNYYPRWERAEEHPTGVDYLVADYLKSIKKRVYIPIPNLVDHRIGKSAIDPRRSSKRVSLTFIDGAD